MRRWKDARQKALRANLLKSLIHPETTVVCRRMVGLYYDDPGTTPEDKCRWAVGAVEEDLSTEEKEILEKAGYKQFLVEGCAKAVKSQWMFRPQLGFMSILMMVWRCYPTMDKFCKEKKIDIGTCMEYYHHCQKDSLGLSRMPVSLYYAMARDLWKVPEVCPPIKASPAPAGL
mmetsp:Transcript_24305/g.47478  ORF Transcript_24305/g.47478 Transcript_24305/m.47478 type:complete len:173 (+) Transcript_24305:266-784(+)